MRVDLSTKLQLLTLHSYRRRQSGCQGGWIDPFVRIDRRMRAHKSSRANPTITWSRRSTQSRTKQPSKYIRFIYNRIILESAAVRAAAVSALSHFGATCEDLLPIILVLLQRSHMVTDDDEVNDRATYFYSVLSRK
jgi:hypothetical protein